MVQLFQGPNRDSPDLGIQGFGGFTGVCVVVRIRDVLFDIGSDGLQSGLFASFGRCNKVVELLLFVYLRAIEDRNVLEDRL